MPMCRHQMMFIGWLIMLSSEKGAHWMGVCLGLYICDISWKPVDLFLVLPYKVFRFMLSIVFEFVLKGHRAYFDQLALCARNIHGAMLGMLLKYSWESLLQIDR